MKSAAALKRYNTVKKLAKLEKQILAEAKANKLNKNLLKGFAKKASVDALDELHKFINFAHESEVFGGLHANKCVLTPEAFLKVVMPSAATPKNVQLIQDGLPGIFSDIWERPDLDMFCEDDCYSGKPCLDIRIIRPIRETVPVFGVSEQNFIDRLLTGGGSNDLTNPKQVIIICNKNSGNNDLSREYASYLTDACGDLDEHESVLALLQALTR